MLLVFLALAQPGRARRDDEAGVALRAEFGVDDSDDHMDVSHATVRDPGLGSVEDPLILGFVVLGRQAVAVHVGPSVGLRRGERAGGDLVRGAVALRNPLHHLLRGAGGCDTRSGETRTHDGHPDAGVTPEDLFDGHDHGDASGVVHHHLGHELPAVQADLGGLLDDRPRELFFLVPLFGVRTHDVDGELMQPLLQGQLVFAQGEGELGHRGSSAMVTGR